MGLSQLCCIWLERRFLLQTFEAGRTEEQITESDAQAMRQLLDEDKEKEELPCTEYTPAAL
jgi:hypothetical protein